MLKSLILAATALASVAATPALAQSTSDDPGFTGFYVGGSFGGSFQSNDAGSPVLFDRDLNGRFGDTVTTAAGANAFGPPNGGFCNGRNITNSIAGGCTNDKDGPDYAARVGFDIQRGPVVFGVVGEFGRAEVRDFSTAFSTTPANYTFARDLRYNGNIRARVGYTPNNQTLFYVTGGGAYGRVRNYFQTSNGLNTFSALQSDDAYGFTGGGGVEQKIGRNFSIGLEYLYTDLFTDRDRVRVGPNANPALTATNPFILGNASGTDMIRGDPHFRTHSGRVVATFRF